HIGQSCIKRGIQCSNRRLNHIIHQKSHNQNSEQWIQKHRRNLFNGLRQFRKYFSQKENQVSCYKSRKKSSKKSGFALRCKHSAYKSDCQCRTVSDTHGNESCKYWEHESKCRISYSFQCRCYRRDRTEVCTHLIGKGINIDAEAINQKRKGNEDTASNYERKHVGNSVHQLCIYLVGSASG